MKNFCTLCLVLTFLIPTAVNAEEELSTLLGNVEQAATAGNYSKALEELEWAKKLLTKKNANQLSTLLPDTLEGYTGAPVKKEGAFGITNISRLYTKDSSKVMITLTQAGKSGMGAGITGLGQMARFMGQQPGMDTFRLEGFTAVLEEKGNRPTLQVFFPTGGVLKFETKKNVDAATLKKMAETINVSKFDKQLRGTS